jgi:hypothetical protein
MIPNGTTSSPSSNIVRQTNGSANVFEFWALMGSIGFGSYITYDTPAGAYFTPDGVTSQASAPTSSSPAAQITVAVQQNIIASTSGIVTTPSQPGFKYALNNYEMSGGVPNILNPGSSNWYGPGNRDSFDRQSNFNTANGRFTAPVSGMYVFHFSWMRNNTATTGTGSQFRFTKNGSSVNMWARYYSAAFYTAYQTGTLTTVTTLAAGDYVNVTTTDSNQSIYADDSYFCGYLVG